MHQNMPFRQITDRILASRKYKALYPVFVERIVKESLAAHPPKKAESQVRVLLHQAWGSYYSQRPDFDKTFSRFQDDYRETHDSKKVLYPFFFSHSSVSERLPFIETFYQEIFLRVGAPSSIVDYGCGLNPLLIFWMGLPATTYYRAFDVDVSEINFLNRCFDLFGVGDRMSAVTHDVFSDVLQAAECAFMFKFLPVLERQRKGSSLSVMRDQPSKRLVVSFPSASLSGRKKGMADFYENWFFDLIRQESWKVEKIVFPSELVFVIEK